MLLAIGTATTFDAISGKGEYLGGVIAPGIGISAEALFSRASKLPRIEIRKPPKVIGDSTVGSMQSRLYFGYVGLVEGILGNMKRELGEAQVLATGGLASLVAAATEAIDRVEEDLTLFGLRLFHSKLN
jgi:type III pantothenate kinase